MKPLFLLMLTLASIRSYTQSTFSFTNKPFSDPEMPNYHRGAQYWNGTSWGTGSAPQVPPGNPTTGAKALYSRYWWNYCEAGQGVYTFTKASLGGDWWRSIEASLEWCANNGAMYTFGNVMTSWDNQGEIFYDGGWAVYPQYLHNLMQAEATTKDWKYSNGGIWVPNWNSPSYLARWRALQDTLKRYIENWKFTPTSGPWANRQIVGKNLLEYVDLRGFGNYGEWHTYPWGDDGSEPAYAKATDSTFKKLIDIGAEVWTNYPLHIPVGAFDDNPWGEGTAFTTWYALTKKTNYGVIGWRRDNIGDQGLDMFLIGNTFTGPNGWKADTAILDRWKFATITGEPLNGNGTCCPYYWHIRNELNTYHYAAFGNGNYGSTAQSVFDSMQVYFKMSGYRYNLNGGGMTTDLVIKQPFNVTLNWRNVGVSPLYQKRWRVVYELKNGSTVVQKFTSKFNPYLFLPNTKDSVITDTFTLGDVPLGNTYSLSVKLEDTVGLLAPLNIAINSPIRNTDGSYTLRSNINVMAGGLPIVWKSFTAQTSADKNVLYWSTTCSQDNLKFIIQRSEDSRTYIDVGEVTSGYQDCFTKDYVYVDGYVTRKTTYYRIKQVSVDGRIDYSKTVAVKSSRKNFTFIQPNPTTGDIIIGVNSDMDGMGVVHVYNSTGQVVQTQTFVKRSPWHNVFMSFKAIPNGIYLVKVKIEHVDIDIKQVIKN